MIIPLPSKKSNGEPMKHMLRKELFRSISRSKGRFLSIFLIVALGAGFYAGIKSTGTEMRNSADDYYDESNLHDLRIVSTYGFSDDNIRAIAGVEHVAATMPGITVDTGSFYEGVERLIHVQSLDFEAYGESQNRPVLQSGRMPENADECVILQTSLDSGKYEIGDTIELSIEKGSIEERFMKQTSFTIVGGVISPLYLSFPWAANSLGSEEPDFNIFVTEDAFEPGQYTDCYCILDGTQKLASYTDEYTNLVDEETSGFAAIEADEQAARKQQVLDENMEDILSGKLDISEYLGSSDGTIPENVWYYFTRENVQGFSMYRDDCNRVDGIAKVFPVFFFLVASLVSLTTMTRMIDEERMDIGTMKAIGYSPIQISIKYISYAGLASTLGAFFGLLVGFQVFPRVIFRTYQIMYFYPSIAPQFRMEFAWYTWLLSVFFTLAATGLAIYSSMRAVPASLMRPKPPKNGKRVFLERITFIWRKIGFGQKVTIRNLVRYKKRFLMTVIGIAGCTALMLAGFGLRDSVLGIVNTQYEDIMKYDTQVFFSESSEDLLETDAAKKLLALDEVQSAFAVFAQSADFDSTSSTKSSPVEGILVVPQTLTNFSDYVDLHERTTKNKLSIPDDGVIISEKLSILLDVDVGDTISNVDDDGNKIDFVVRGICENYADHYVYMSKETYEEAFSVDFSTSIAFVKLTSSDDATVNKVEDFLKDNDEYIANLMIHKAMRDLNRVFKSLDYVIIVLIISAFSLAIVVLYNLTNINIKERIREIATLKVLGFYDLEVSTYIFRENMVITAIGAILGLGLGRILHFFVIQTAEIDIIMFQRDVAPVSYLWSFLLTVFFAMVINFIMHFYLRRITMVESLKSVE